jgi:hypothetical protein
MNKPYREMTISELVLARAQIQGYIDIAVVEARRAGRTWAAIGSMLGVSTAEAHRRYSWCEKTANPGHGA